MLARVARTLYWTARDLERAETHARVLEASLGAGLEHSPANGATGRLVWEPAVRLAADMDAFLRDHRRADERSVTWFMSLGEHNPDSVLACVRRARDRARGVRDRLPTEVWEGVNSAWLDLAEWGPDRLGREGAYPFCRDVLWSVHLVQGLIDQGMSRDEGWWFMRLGRHLERAERTIRLLRAHLAVGADAALADAVELHGWRSLLGAASAQEAYLRVGGDLSPDAVARFLMLDPRFPRSVAFCLREVERAIAALVEMDAMMPAPPPLVLARAARETVEAAARRPWGRDAGDLLERLLARCASIDRAIDETCFEASYERAPALQNAQAARQAQN